MKIEQQVCTIEQAKRLKELGVTAESIFYHYCGLIRNDRGIKPAQWVKERNVTNAVYAAYTVAELCQLLPDYYPSWRFPIDGGKKWIATVIASPKPPGVDDIHTLHEFDRYGDTQAEALATLLIALLETGAVTVEEVNSKIKQP